MFPSYYESDKPAIEFNPDKSPLDAVSSFYNYLKIRKLDKAYALLADELKAGQTYEQWQEGYKTELDTTILDIKVQNKKKNIIWVSLRSKDLVGDEVAYRFFQGTWQVSNSSGHWRLWQSNIIEVPPPENY